MNINEIARLGSNVKPVIQNENCSVLMLNDATGEGFMPLFYETRTTPSCHPSGCAYRQL